MKRTVVVGGILLLAVAAILAWWPSQPGPTSDTGSSPISVVVSTPSPVPPIGEAVVKLADSAPGPIRLCAGEMVRFINDRREPVILTASDFSFSSGVLQPGDAFAIFPTSGVTVEVSGLDGAIVVVPYRIEVMQCDGSLQRP